MCVCLFVCLFFEGELPVTDNYTVFSPGAPRVTLVPGGQHQPAHPEPARSSWEPEGSEPSPSAFNTHLPTTQVGLGFPHPPFVLSCPTLQPPTPTGMRDG